MKPTTRRNGRSPSGPFVPAVSRVRFSTTAQLNCRRVNAIDGSRAQLHLVESALQSYFAWTASRMGDAC